MVRRRKVKRVKAVRRRTKTGLSAGSLSWMDGEKLVANDPLRMTVLKRVAPAVQKLVRNSPEGELYQALQRETSIDTLIHLLSGDAAAANVAHEVSDPLREARARAARRISELISSEGGTIGVQDVAKRLRISRAAVDKRRKNGALIGIDDGGRSVQYPSWQFTRTGTLPGLDRALKALVISDPWMRMQFFLNRDSDFGGRPLDALRNGEVERVIAAARRYGRSGEDG